METNKNNITELFSKMTNYFSPKIIGEVNNVYVKLAKIKGDDVPWHTHDSEDEMFYVIKGTLTMQIEKKESFDMKEGDLYIVKRGMQHRVFSEEECLIMLVENKETKHTGNVQSRITKSIDEQF